ncbi:hypothetical protein [Sorangium sp. So ce1182]|uniref:hypothetical protein n=1 Tax=Sorangium sp. So ce1182 TaxID=3133334 RepID=UPI003F5DA3C1
MITHGTQAFIRCAGGAGIAVLSIGCAQIFDFDKEYLIRDETSEGGGGAGGLPGGLDCYVKEIPPGVDLHLSLIDDLEDGNNRIKYTEGRHAYWFVFNDGTGGVQAPTDSARIVSAIDPPRPGIDGEISKKAMRTSGEGFTGWGAGVGTDLNSAFYDASEYRGITFWARADGDSPTELNVDFVDRQTVWDGDICVQEPTEPHTSCNDHFPVEVFPCHRRVPLAARVRNAVRQGEDG